MPASCLSSGGTKINQSMNYTSDLPLVLRFSEAANIQEEVIKKALSVPFREKRTPIDDLDKIVGQAFGVEPDKLVKGRRVGRYMAARKTFCFIATRLKWSASMLSRKFDIDRTTVTHHHDTIKNAIWGWDDPQIIAFLKVVNKYYDL